MTLTPKIIMLGVLLAGISATALINEVAISWYPPTWHLADGRWGTYDPAGVRSCIGARLLAAIGDQSSAWRWYDCAKRLWDANALDGFNWRYWALVSAAGFTLLAAFGFALAVRFGRPPFRVVRGRKLLTGRPAKRALLEVTKQEAELSGVGLDLIPGLPISLERETRHWLIWGSVGAGKTQTMLHLILGALVRGDGVLVLDVKGDMTETLPGKPLLIAPQDRRSHVWDIARDCRTKQDARELANRLIPDSQDPMWSDSARDIFVVCVATLQATKGDNWSWTDLHEISTASAEILLAHARKHHIDAVRLSGD